MGQIVTLAVGGQRRPVLVISAQAANKVTGTIVALPITDQISGFAREVVLPEGLPIKGSVLLAHIRHFDYKARNFSVACRVPEAFLTEIISSVCAMFLR